jgi:C4-dicarboxylate transporter DctM subunit
MGGQKKRGVAFLASAVDGTASIFSVISAVLMFFCAIIVMIDIVARFLNHPYKWAMDLTTYLMVIYIFLSLAYAMKSGAHICADIFVSRLNDRMQHLMKAFGFLFSGVGSAVLAYYTFIWAVEGLHSGVRAYTATRYFMWPARMVAAISLILLALMAMRLMAEEFYKARRNADGCTFGLGLNKPWIIVPAMFILLFFSVILFKANPILGITLMLITLLIAGTPIGFSILLTAICCLFFTFGGWKSVLTSPPSAFNFVNSYSIMSLPMFLFAGNVMARGGLGEALFNLGKVYVGHIKGGLGIAVIIACTIFGALSGSGTACALTIGAVAYPLLVKHGYNRGMAAGLIAVAGGIGILIPPSNSFITYGLISDVPIGELFVAGIIPGLLMGLFLIIAMMFLILHKHKTNVLPKATWSERRHATGKGIWAILMPVVVLGGIYNGIFTVTEAAAVSAVYAIIYTIFAGALNKEAMWKVLLESIQSVAFLMLIMMSAAVLQKNITLLRLPDKLLALLGDTPGWMFIIVLMIFCILLGCFLEGVSITTLTVPVTAPILLAYGYNLTWYGVLLSLNLTLAAVTPPVGLNLFVMQKISGENVNTVIKGALYFCFCVIILMVVVALFPGLSLWLPSKMT